MQTYSIGQLAKASGLSTKTLRFYEASGVLTSPTRSENGYRTYSASSLEEARLLKYARELGIPLSEIKKLMKGCEGQHCEHTEEYIVNTIDAFLAKVDSQLKGLTLLQAKLKLLKSQLGNQDCQSYCCDILHQLMGLSQNEKKGGESHG